MAEGHGTMGKNATSGVYAWSIFAHLDGIDRVVHDHCGSDE
jgi:hypothetical protein